MSKASSMNKRASFARTVIFIVGLVVSVAYVIPFFLVFINAFKPIPEIIENPLAFPVEFTWDNFNQALEKMNFWVSLMNSIIITTFSLLALILVSLKIRVF